MAGVAGIAGPGAIVRTRQACRHAPTGVSDCRRGLRRTAAIPLRGPQTSACGGESGCFPAIAQPGAGRRLNAWSHRSARGFVPKGGQRPAPGTSASKARGRGGQCRRVHARPSAFNRHRAAKQSKVFSVPCFLRCSGWPPNRLGICRGASRMPALRRVAANERNVQIARIGGNCRRKRACGTILPQASLQPA